MLLNSYRFGSGGSPEPPDPDDDATVFINRFAVEPDLDRKIAITNLFTALKDAGIYQKLDSLYVVKYAQDVQSALLDWKRPTKFATLMDTATIDLDNGFDLPNTGNPFVKSDYTPSIDAVHYTSNSAGVGIYISVLGETGDWLFGSQDSNYNQTGTTAKLTNSGGNFSFNNVYINGYIGVYTSSTLSSIDGVGIFQSNRYAGDSSEMFFNGVSIGTNSTNKADRALSTQEFYINSFNNDGSPAAARTKEAAIWFGAPLDSSEQLILKEALEDYFIALTPPIPHDPDYELLLSRMAVQPDPELATRIETLIVDLKNEGIWDKLDSLYIPKGLHTSQAGCLDWKRSDKSALLQDGANWSRGAGFEGNGTSAYVDTQFNPATDGILFTLNDFGVGVVLSEPNPAAGQHSLTGTNASGNNSNLYMVVSSNYQITGYPASTTIFSTASALATASSQIHLNRTSSTNVEVFINGVSAYNTGGNTVISLPSYNFYILSVNNGGVVYTPGLLKVGMWYAGASLIADELVALKSILETFWLPDSNIDVSSYNYDVPNLLSTDTLVINPIEVFTFSTPAFTQITYV